MLAQIVPRLTSLVLFSLLATASVTANAALKNVYDFDGDYSDTLGNGLDLVPSGGTISAGRYEFTRAQGLRLTSALADTASYAIEIKLRKTDPIVEGNYGKVIDFQDLTDDNGLYLYGSSILFYDDDTPVGAFSQNNDFILAMERSGGQIRLFLNGNMLYSFADTGDQGVSVDNILNFVADDNDGAFGETFDGSIDWIRIHDDASTFVTSSTAVPIPAAAWIFSALLLGFLGAIRSRRG